MWQIVWSICFPFGELNIQHWNTQICSAFKTLKNKTRVIVQSTPTCDFFNWLLGFQCSYSLTLSLLRLHPSFLLFFPSPVCSLSYPPLNQTAVLAGYHAWSIPYYQREINYLDQAAGERGNNERMLLLPRQWPWSLNMNLSLAEEMYGARCGSWIHALFTA